VDAALADLIAGLDGSSDDAAALVAEVAIANLVCMVDDTMGDDDTMQRTFWLDVAADLVTRDDEPSTILATGLTRLVDPAFGIAFSAAGPAPAWLDQLATAQLRRAIVVKDLAGDGVGITLGYDGAPDGAPDGGSGAPGLAHSVLVYVDNNLGGIAKDIGIGPPIDEVRASSSTDAELVAIDVPPGQALGLVLDGLGQTLHDDDAPTTQDYDHLQSLLVLRVTRADVPIEMPPPPAELSEAERDALVRDFMHSYGARVEADEELVEGIARLWVEHAADYTIGGPLRASAVLVELFLADWVPRHLTGEHLALVPAVVKEWLRFVGSRVPVPSSLVTTALSAVEQYAPVMRRRAEDPSAWEVPYPRVGESDDDPLEATWLSLPELGVAPRPDCAGLSGPAAAHLEHVARHAWVLAGETLGTDYAGPAFEVAERLARQAPETFAKADPASWPAAITWLLAEDDDIVGRGKFLSPTRLAAELGVGAPTLRARVRQIREALG
jgi:hypothetical protein